MKKFTAFTLSEVLITVAIIGVISALTMPTLLLSYQREAQTTQLRKAVNEIESAIDMLITEEGKTSMSATSLKTNAGLTSFLQTHLKISKTCSSSSSGCFASSNYKSINGSTSQAISCSSNSYVLSSSAAICATKSGTNIDIYIDTNSAKGPNTGGRDMFHISVQANGIAKDASAASDCVSKPLGDGCFNKLVNNNWKMNY